MTLKKHQETVVLRLTEDEAHFLRRAVEHYRDAMQLAGVELTVWSPRRPHEIHRVREGLIGLVARIVEAIHEGRGATRITDKT